MTTQYEGHFSTLASSLQDMHDYLVRVQQGCEQVTLNFQTGSPDKGLDMVLQIVEGMSYLLSLTNSVKVMLKINLEDIMLKGGYSAVALVGEVGRICREIAEAAETKDYTLLGDLVEYDLFELAIQAQTMVEIFYQKLEEGAGK